MAFCWQHPWLSIALMPHFGSTMPFPKVERILFTVYNYFSLSRIFFSCNFKGGRHCMSIEQKYSIPSTFPIWFVYPSCLLLTAQVPFISPFIWTPYQLGHLHQDYPKLSKTAIYTIFCVYVYMYTYIYIYILYYVYIYIHTYTRETMSILLWLLCVYYIYIYT